MSLSLGTRLAGGAWIVAMLLGLAGRASAADPQWLAQNWTAADRAAFYTMDQGSRIIPYAWIKALDRGGASGLFLADGLARYGYLANPKSASNPEGLPVGFMLGPDKKGISPSLAMSCAACHTRQLQVPGQPRPYRIDGGPALADFQSFLADLSAAAKSTLADSNAFDAFAKRVLGVGNSATAAAGLRSKVQSWYANFGDFMATSLPPHPWGPGRLDAFGMIFNRVAGLDLQIPDNIKVADAPVRYPFLWNAPFQDRTQWNGGVPNGLFILGMGRNLGEEYGVFGRFSPAPDFVLPVRYNGPTNSANFVNLQKLEELVFKLRAPRWPKEWGLDAALAKRGDALFQANCASCHGLQKSAALLGAWATPVRNVGTDERMFVNARRTVATGLLAGTLQPSTPPKPLGDPALAVDLLGTAVVGTLMQELVLPQNPLQNGVLNALHRDLQNLGHNAKIGARALAETRLRDLFNQPPSDPTGAAYEARVLSGI